MYISKVSLVNYRNFANSKLLFGKGINTVIGENGSGKTNLFRAVRLLLDDSLLRFSYRLDERDFCRALGDWRGHWIVISVEFGELSTEEAIQALFVHGVGNIEDGQVERATYNLIFRPNHDVRLRLSQLKNGDHDGLAKFQSQIAIDDYEIIFTGKSVADFNDPATYKQLVGDFELVDFDVDLENPIIGIRIPHQLSVSREVSFTFVKALRDVVSDFHNNRTNPLLKLLRYKSEELDVSKYEDISKSVKEVNEQIEALDDVEELRTGIRETIRDTVGETYSPTSLSIRSDLPNEAEELLQSLKLFIGESEEDYEGAIHELSLGGANLIYLTLKLLEFKYQKDKQSVANFLFIEEPEAHIHTHIQKTLFENLDYGDTQIIYSTHSTHISEVSNVRKVNVLTRHGVVCEAYQPSTDLTEEQTRNLERYLDAVRTNLLFAKSVILVEGDAEEIVVPRLAKKILGVSLDELGISLINIRSTGFENVATIFHDKRLHRRCAIVTDLDKSIIDTNEKESDDDKTKSFKKKCERSERSGERRQERLSKFAEQNAWIEVFYANHTFEVDFVMSGNDHEVKQLVDSCYSRKKKQDAATEELGSDEVAIFGRRVLTMANSMGKGWFAVELSNHVDYYTYLPDYILSAILFARQEFGKELWLTILRYRHSCLVGDAEELDDKKSAELQSLIDGFKMELIDLAEILEFFENHVPDDPICRLLMEKT